MPYKTPKYLVPKIWATIPLVAGTVDNHKNPKLAPKINALTLLAGKNINNIIINEKTNNKERNHYK